MNINQLMKQAQVMQKKMQEAQEQIEQMEVTGTAGGGMVTIVMNGKGTAKSIKIDPKVIDASDKEILEDLIVAAINDAKAKSEEESGKKMSDLTGGLNLPAGFKMPF